MLVGKKLQFVKLFNLFLKQDVRKITCVANSNILFESSTLVFFPINSFS